MPGHLPVCAWPVGAVPPGVGAVAADGAVSDAAGEAVVLVPAAYVTAAPPASDAATAATATCLMSRERIIGSAFLLLANYPAPAVDHRAVMAS
jgi:hypothetical protein